MTAKTQQDLLSSKIHSQNGICVNQTDKLTISDEIGRMTQVDVRKFWQTLETQDARRNFVWLAFTCLAPDSALDILKLTVLRDAKDGLEAEVAEEWDRIGAERTALARQQAEVAGKVEALTKENETMRKQAQARQEEIGTFRRYAADLEDKVDALSAELATYRTAIEGLKALKALLA